MQACLTAVAVLLPLTLAGGERSSPPILGIEVSYGAPRIGPESRRADLEARLVEEIERAGCTAGTAGPDAGADLWLTVSIEEFSLEEEEGGEPGLDDRTGAYRAGRSYLCRISLSFALLADRDGEPWHADRLTMARREGTTSNPLFEPRDQAYRRALDHAVRELRRRACKKIPILFERLARERGVVSR